MVSNRAWPSFDESMQFSAYYNHKRTDDHLWGTLKERYEQISSLATDRSRIPKILHQIWLGGDMPSLERRLVQHTKNTLDSNWEHILWTEADIDKIDYNKEHFNATPNLGQKSDLLRYAILNQYGGVYMDTDFLLLDSFDHLLHLDFFSGIAYDSRPNLFNGLIGSSAHNPVITSLLELDRPIEHRDAMLVMDSTGPFFHTRRFFECLRLCDRAVALPNSFFYQYPNFECCKSLGGDYNKYIKPETICCHMWSSSWM